jgi:hypothetical protein
MNTKGEKEFDAYHHLLKLQQALWSVRYENYTAVGIYDLPAKIYLEREDLQVTIVINTWQL